MNTNKNENVVLLLKVLPDGPVEQGIMKAWKAITKKYKITNASVQLGAIFNQEYNQYVIKCENRNMLDKCWRFLSDTTWNMYLKSGERFCPVVSYAVERHC